MRIVAFINKDSGPGYHRVILPLMTMHGVDVFITNNLLEEHFEKGCDIFFYNRVLPDSSDEKIAALKEKYGFKTCVDIDDYWLLDPHHILYAAYQEEMFAERQIKHIVNADIVLTTHERLAKEISAFNENVHVCPNAIPHTGQFAIDKERCHLTRLFWQGTPTHKADIFLLQGPANGLHNIASKIRMVMAGYVESEEWNAMAEVYTSNFRHQYKIIEAKPLTDYYQAYKEADICLVPLVNSMFNGMKSNLKVLEAANMGLPVICSNVNPYKELPVFYCNNTSDWVAHVKRLVKSKNRQRDAGNELLEFCNKHFNFNKINKERKQILEYTASKQTA